MATTKTAIINRALTKLGSRQVTNIDTDNTVESRTMLNLYDMALENILSETLWTFAKRRSLLATTTDTVVFNSSKESLNIVYQRPVGCVRIFSVNDIGADWYEEDDKIISDTTGLGILYTFLNTNPATYPPYFATCFSDLLAAEACFPLLNSGTKVEELFKVYEKVSLPKAKATNAQTGKAQEANDNYWENAKYGGPNIKEFS
jgi:hypothetical protein